jgi:hypothetical protein
LYCYDAKSKNRSEIQVFWFLREVLAQILSSTIKQKAIRYQSYHLANIGVYLMLGLILLLVVCGSGSFPSRLSELDVETALDLFSSWRATQNPLHQDVSRGHVNERAFRKNHLYVRRRNVQLRAMRASYSLELNEVFGDHDFEKEQEGEENDWTLSKQQKTTKFSPGFLDWRNKRAVASVKVCNYFFFRIYF